MENNHLGKYTNCNTQFSDNTNVIPITALYNKFTIRTLGVFNCWEGICVLKPAQACFFL